MKRLSIISMVLVVLASACKKEIHDAVDPVSGMYVINGVLGNVTVKVNPGIDNGFAYSRASLQVGYGVGTYYNVKKGSRNIVAVNAADTTKTLFSRTINFQQNINTMYLFGQYPAVDTLFREENDIPYTQTTLAKPDSVFYVRFVNLSPNSTPLNVKFVTGISPNIITTTEASALAYKGITVFKKYDANFKASNYTVEVWNTANTIKLASINLPLATTRFKTLSIIVKGIMADPPTPPITNQLSLSQVFYF